MKTTTFFLFLSLSLQSMANVYPDQREVKAESFIKIDKLEKGYSFKTCSLIKPDKCKQLGKQTLYTHEEIAKKIEALNEKIAMSNAGALVTVGFSFILSARYLFIRNTIESKALDQDLTLKFEVGKGGLETGTIREYIRRLESALKTTPLE